MTNLNSFSQTRWLLLAIMLLLGAPLSWSQGSNRSSSEDDNFSVDGSHMSDYSVKIFYNLTTTVCWPEDNADVNLTTASYGGTFIYSVNHTVYNSHYFANVGPSYNQQLYAWANHKGGVFDECVEHGTETILNCTTQAIYNPTNVSATDGDFDTQVVITWQKGTHIPNNQHSYIILRGSTPLDTVPGSDATFTDTGLTPGQSFTYTVKTYTTLNGGKTSTGVSDMGATFSVGLDASDGLYYGKTKLSWNDLSEVATDIRVERSIPQSSGREELAILNKNATTYTDADGIPGFQYAYFVTPISTNPFLSDGESGYSKANGKISGHVTSQLGAGVDSVEIYLELLSNIPLGGAALDPSCTEEYCTMTDISGFYEFKDVYYFTGAEFRIWPVKGTHLFSPDELSRELNANAQVAGFVDFVDLNVLTVGGRVTYPVGPGSGGACGVPDVAILIDNKDVGIRTDEDGEWQASLNNNGTYKFSAKLHDHDYEDAAGDSVTTLFINADKANIDFVNQTVRTLKVTAQGGCNAPLGSSVEIRVTANGPGNCFEEYYETDEFGLLTLNNLPPRAYTIEVYDVFGAPNPSTILDQLSVPIDVDLTELDTMMIVTDKDSLRITPAHTLTDPNGNPINIPADTVFVQYKDTTFSTDQNVRFIYRAPIEITVDFEDAGAEVFCSPNDIVVLDQKDEYLLEFNVKEMLGNCYIDTGTLVIYDEIADMETIGQKIPISNGIARYLLKPGDPDMATSVSHNHEKFLFIVPQIDFADVDPVTFWAVVTGIKSNAPSFITRTPEIPQLILHDPPGDNSFTTIEKGTTYTTMSSTEIQVGGSAGLFLNLKAGPSAEFFGIKAKAGGSLQFEARAGRDNFKNDVIINTITFLENFSTSTGPNFVGEQGDVFIGAALNQTFALSRELTINSSNCEFSIDTVVEMGYTDFATTFIYTEHHIENTLIPNLYILKGLADTTTNDGRKEYNRLLADIHLWNNILAKNRAARDTNAVFKENLSFSAGADLSKSYGSVDASNNSFTYNAFFEANLKVGAYAEIESPAFYLSVDGGAMGSFKTARTEIRDTTDETTRTVTYTLSDDDIGDYFSVNVYRDVVYDVPAFKTVSGVSSCPHEPNTQMRENPTLSIYPPIVNNVPADEAANFILDITNDSENGETRQYAVKLVSNSNPDGAFVNVGGSDINVFPIQYFFDAGQTLSLAMTVYKGPLSSNYDSLGVMIYSECEYDIWATGGNLNQADTTWFSVNFLSECTNVSMHLPEEGWLVNQASNNVLHTAFTGYDVNNELFESVTIQIKRDGYGYQNVVTIPIEDLIDPFFDYFMDVSNFPDGNYTLRARANCGLDGGITYSSEVTGIIDRTSIAPFGIPTPADGYLREGQEVSITFDKELYCAFNEYEHEITLIREDTDEAIPFTPQCFGNKIIFNTNTPLIDQLDLEGVLVTARVHLVQDVNGNVQEYPTEWSFLVNVNPVFWDPETIAASGFEKQAHVVKGTLKNTSLISKAFSLDTTGNDIVEYPDWLVPVQKNGTVLSENSYDVFFEVNPDLEPGLYSGEVVAMVDSLPVRMDVTFEMLAIPVYWPFDPSKYQYTMTVVAQFSLDDTNTNLSTDPRDLVGAFVNGEVRGIANIEYLPGLNIYRAFLTVYSNHQGGGGAETVTFRFWHALNGVEYGAVETTLFTLDQTMGTINEPFILHPQGFFQIIPLNKGWTWISFNVTSGTMPREQVFQTILNNPAANVITIKSKTQTSQYTPGSSWNGNLTNFTLGQGYLVHLSNAPDTLRVVGFPSATNISVNVATNWNWIGFPRLLPEPVNDVLSTLTPAVGNTLKSQYKFATYQGNPNGWVGNLNEFSPGDGYKLFLSTGGTIEFEESRGDGYDVNPHLYEYNMNITGYLDLHAIGEHDEDDLMIGAFIDNECRGTGLLEYVNGVSEFRTFMLVHGNVTDLGKRITFKILNEDSGFEYQTNGQPLTFIADGLIGTISNPYLFFESTTATNEITTEGYHLEQNLPNPTSGICDIGFTLPVTEQVFVNLYDVNGNLVRNLLQQSYPAGHHVTRVNLSDIPMGIYYYQLKTDNFNAVKKLVRQ